MDSIKGYLKDLEVDKYNLDKALVSQPILFAKYAELHANSQRLLDEAKEELDVYDAELDKKIRLRFQEEGIKSTETMVKNEITIDTKHIQLQKGVIELKETMNLCGIARAAFEQRKVTLESLVKLWIGGYYADVKLPEAKDIKREYERKNISDKCDSPKLHKRGR